MDRWNRQKKNKIENNNKTESLESYDELNGNFGDAPKKAHWFIIDPMIAKSLK